MKTSTVRKNLILNDVNFTEVKPGVFTVGNYTFYSMNEVFHSSDLKEVGVGFNFFLKVVTELST